MLIGIGSSLSWSLLGSVAGTWGGSEAVSAHDVEHRRAIRRTSGGGCQYGGDLFEVGRSEHTGGRDAQDGRVDIAVVDESVNGAARDRHTACPGPMGTSWPSIVQVSTPASP